MKNKIETLFDYIKTLCESDLDRIISFVLGIVFFDSGMYQGNKHPYSQWRAYNKYWDSLIIERYE